MAKKGFKKFFNHTFTNEYGKWQSTLEFDRYLFLKDKQDKGEIEGLERQVKFEIIPRQTELVEVKLKTKTKWVERVVEKRAVYTADFVYFKKEEIGYVRIIEDTKSEHTRKEKDYILRKKLMRIQGHPIVEVLSPTQDI